jgi:predicted transcriptional regulator
MATPEQHQLCAKVPADLFAQVQEIARRADRSVSAELRRALRHYVEAQSEREEPTVTRVG